MADALPSTGVLVAEDQLSMMSRLSRPRAGTPTMRAVARGIPAECPGGCDALAEARTATRWTARARVVWSAVTAAIAVVTAIAGIIYGAAQNSERIATNTTVSVGNQAVIAILSTRLSRMEGQIDSLVHYFVPPSERHLRSEAP